MSYRNIIYTFLIFSAALRAACGVELVIVGDSIQKMSNLLGTPEMEYALNGQMIHQYVECTVVSSNEVVVSVDYHVEVDLPEEESTAADEPLTIDDIKERALKNDAESQYLLAYSYQFGKLVDQNYGKAVGWYTRAAKQGYMPAQHNLGYLYMNGKGVERDLEQAYVWALLASENGNNSLRQVLEHRLSDAQKEAAATQAKHLLALMKAEELSEMDQ